MKTFFAIIISIATCLFIGFTAQSFQTEALTQWYPFLTKSILTPPGIIFPIVWTIIYILMGISVGLLWNKSVTPKKELLYLFVIQFILNFLWSIMFFYFRNPLLGLINIAILDIAVISYTSAVYKSSKLSGWLMIPYIIWLALATYLNFYIFVNN